MQSPLAVRAQRLLGSPNFHLEFWFSLVFLLLGVAISASTNRLTEWPAMAACGFVIAAVAWARHSAIRAIGIVACVAWGLFATGFELAAFVAVTAFVVVEVQVAAARWRAGTATAIVLLFWFAVGSPMAGWEVSRAGQILVGVMCLAVACAVGLLRRLQQAERAQRQAEYVLAQQSTQFELARSLHDRVADSLTRIVLLSGSAQTERADIQAEARRAIDSLRGIITQLREEPNNAVAGFSKQPLVEESQPFSGMMANAIEELRGVGLNPSVHVTGVEVGISPEVERAVREVFTNVLKHGQDPVRILAEVSDGYGRLFVVNRPMDTPRVAGESSGIGLESMIASIEAAGGTAEVSESKGKMRVALAFPVTAAPEETPL